MKTDPQKNDWVTDLPLACMCGVKRTNDIGETFEVISSFHRKVVIPLRLSKPKTCYFKVSVVKGVGHFNRLFSGAVSYSVFSDCRFYI